MLNPRRRPYALVAWAGVYRRVIHTHVRMENPELTEQSAKSLPRAPASWFVLLLLFTTLIFLTVAQLRAPNLGKGKHSYLLQESAIRVAMKQKSLLALFGSNGGTSSMMRAGSADDSTMSELAASAKKDSQAARLYVGAKYESEGAVSPEDLKLLSSYPDDANQRLARIYGAKKLVLAQAKSLTEGLPQDEFASELARIHAYEKAGDSRPRKALSPPWKATGMIIMLLGFFVALPVGVVVWALYFHFRSLGRLQPKGHAADPVSLPEADRFAYRAVLLIGSFLTISMFFSQFPDMPVPTRLFLTYGVMAATVLGLHRLPVFGLSLPLARVGVRRDQLGKHILWGIAGYFAALPGMLIAALIGSQLMKLKIFGPSSHPATELMESSPSAATVLALLFAAAIVAPFWEEIMFRGTLLPALARVLGRPLWAILASSLLFAGIHPQGIPLWLGLGFIGAMNCLLAYQTRSLVPSMVLHFLNNALILLFTIFLF